MRPLTAKNSGGDKSCRYSIQRGFIVAFALLTLLPMLTACDTDAQPTPPLRSISGAATPTAATVAVAATTPSPDQSATKAAGPTDTMLPTPKVAELDGGAASATATDALSATPTAPPAVATMPAEPTPPPLAGTSRPVGGRVAATPVPAITVIAAATPATTHNNQPPTSVPDSLSIRRGPLGKREVAITFDAGGGSGNVPAILQALRQRGIHITFFLTGKWVADNPDAARAIAADGHDIGNHTYNHLHMAQVKDDNQVRQEVDSAETQIQSVTGVDPRPYFRFPYGESNPHLRQLVSSMGYISVLWTLDSLDSVGQPKSAQFLIERVTHSRMNLDGAIILMHIGNMTSADALPTILDRLSAQGYRVVTIAELLR